MKQNVASSSSHRHYWTVKEIEQHIGETSVVVFTKGPEACPKCGFSRNFLEVVKECGKPYKVVDVCEDRSILAALRAYAGAKALPLIYVNGELITTSETFSHMVETGELREKLKAAH